MGTGRGRGTATAKARGGKEPRVTGRGSGYPKDGERGAGLGEGGGQMGKGISVVGKEVKLSEEACKSMFGNRGLIRHVRSTDGRGTRQAGGWLWAAIFAKRDQAGPQESAFWHREMEVELLRSGLFPL